MVYDFTEDELDEAGALDLPMPHLGDLQTIHPIFQRLNFPRLSDIEYTALLPSLALCSAYLAESFDVQIFWQTILYGKRQLIPNTPDWHQVARPSPPFTEAQYHIFDSLLQQMSCMFAFQFAPCTDAYATEPWGQTTAWDRASVDPTWTPPHGLRGLCSVITLNPAFLEAAVAAHTYLTSPAADAAPDLELICLILRQQWFFAVTVVHELAHGVNNAQRQHRLETEPFFEGHRRAEMGYAWEQFVHGGRICQVHGSRNTDCGLYFGTWPPGAESNEVIGPGGASLGYGWNRRASRRVFHTEYVVPMRHIQRLHTRYFWEVEVRRFGLAELRIPKTLGLRSGNWSREARFGAGQVRASVSGGSSRNWSADEDGRVRRM